MSDGVVLTVLLPVRNETMNLRIMLRILRAVLTIPHEIIVIFDSETDSSIAVVEEVRATYPQARPLLNKIGRGVAGAISTGVNAAQGERILIFAADEVGPVLAIDDMMTLMDEGAEFVSVTRYAHGGRRLGGSIIGQILSRTANGLLGVISGMGLSDATTGIKLFRRTDFNRLTQGTSAIGWSIAFEMAINAQLLGLKLGEVPTISIDRLFGGKSSFQLVPWVIGYLGYFATAMRKLPRAGKPSVTVRIPPGM
ncbi:MAG: glycosyltransferase [Alphaproteobacteria bacterium]|nr:glycosyltransferase [Alphaproteobacteria bacterium]